MKNYLKLKKGETIAKEYSEARIVILIIAVLLIFTAGIFLGYFLSGVRQDFEKSDRHADYRPPFIDPTEDEFTPPPYRGPVKDEEISRKEIRDDKRKDEFPPDEELRPEERGKPIEIVSIEQAGGEGTLPGKGKKNAPVTIIEFSDFQSTFSGRYFIQIFPQLDKAYIDTGYVRYFFRDFPLPFHQFAQKAAEAARCANEQGKFWEYHGKIFENQQAVNDENLKEWAKELGLDTKQFNESLESGKFTEAVKKDYTDGQLAGIHGLPSFFINGELMVGSKSYEWLTEVIDGKLAGN